MILYVTLIAYFSIALLICILDYKGRISTKIMYITMFLLMGFITSNDDFPAYLRLYSIIKDFSAIGETDPGFGLLMWVGNCLGLDYFGFLKALTILGLVFLSLVLKKNSKVPAIMLALYFVLNFPTETIQVRSFIADTIIYILLINIVNERKLDFRKHTLVLIVAVAFHAVSFYFVLALLTYNIKNYRKLFVAVIGMIALIPATAVILRYIPIPMIQMKLNIYFNTHRETIGSGILVYIMLYILLTLYIYIKFKKESDYSCREKLQRLLGLNLICMIAVGMVIYFNSNFYRIIRIMMMGDFIVLGNIFYEKRKLNYLTQIIIWIGLTAIMIVNEYLSGSFKNIISNNVLFGGLT